VSIAACHPALKKIEITVDFSVPRSSNHGELESELWNAGIQRQKPAQRRVAAGRVKIEMPMLCEFFPDAKPLDTCESFRPSAKSIFRMFMGCARQNR